MNPISNEDCASVHFEKFDGIAQEEFCATVDTEYNYIECMDNPDVAILSGALCEQTCEQDHGEVVLHFISQGDKVSAVVVGLSSATNYCDFDKPLVFTRVSAYMEWIETYLRI
jgi:secreted trypsin-like serine protease